jgi:hypothetical protein
MAVNLEIILRDFLVDILRDRANSSGNLTRHELERAISNLRVVSLPPRPMTGALP